MKRILFLFPMFINTMIAKAQMKRDTLYINKEANQVVFMDTTHSTFHQQVFKSLLPDSLLNETNLPPMVSPQKGYSKFLGQCIKKADPFGSAFLLSKEVVYLRSSNLKN